MSRPWAGQSISVQHLVTGESLLEVFLLSSRLVYCDFLESNSQHAIDNASEYQSYGNRGI